MDVVAITGQRGRDVVRIDVLGQALDGMLVEPVAPDPARDSHPTEFAGK